MAFLSRMREAFLFQNRDLSREAGRGPLRSRSDHSQSRRARARVAALVELLEPRMLLSATITTDKADYPPGSTAIITGTGWKAGETVDLHVFNETTSNEETPWT